MAVSQKDKRQVFGGVVLSYLTIIANSIYGFVIAPYIMFHAGISDFGVYQTIASLSNAIMVIDVGLGATITRFTADYIAKDNIEKIGGLLKISLVFTIVLTFVISVVGIITYNKFPEIYNNSFTPQELDLGQNLLLLFFVNMILVIYDDILSGLIVGTNKLIVANGIKLAKIIIRYIMILALLPIVKSTIIILYINIFLTFLFMIYEIVLCKPFFKHITNGEPISRSLIKEIMTYSVFIVLIGIISQVNSNLDNVIIGALLGSSSVAVYSFGLSLFASYNHLATSISKNMLPTVSKVLSSEPSSKESLIIKVGRTQFLLLGAALFGFFVLGRDFVKVWLGDTFSDVYWITLVLLIPATLELCVNTCLTILRALNKLGFRTSILICTTFVNLIITFWGTKHFGYYAAAIGTATSVTIGSVIIMNIYYIKELKINIIRVYLEIFKGIVPCLILASLPTWILSKCLSASWLSIGIEISCFLVVYVIGLLSWGFQEQEKLKFISYISRVRKSHNS